MFISSNHLESKKEFVRHASSLVDTCLVLARLTSSKLPLSKSTTLLETANAAKKRRNDNTGHQDPIMSEYVMRMRLSLTVFVMSSVVRVKKCPKCASCVRGVDFYANFCVYFVISRDVDNLVAKFVIDHSSSLSI